MSPRKLVSIGLVILLHALVGYAFITGLAYNVIKHAAQDLKVVDVKDQPPPPEQKPPPPPPEQKFEPPPIVAPPPIVQVQTIAPPVIYTAPVAPPVIHVQAPVAPPPPAPPSIAKPAQLRGDQNFGITDDDYPTSASRAEEQGTTGVAFDVGVDGHVTNCRVTSSSGSSTLDSTTCALIMRRARYSPAQDAQGNKLVTPNYHRSIRWVLPKG